MEDLILGFFVDLYDALGPSALTLVVTAFAGLVGEIDRARWAPRPDDFDNVGSED